MRDRRFVAAGIVLVFVMVCVPFVSATVDRDMIPASQDPNAEDNPAAIASLKAHIAYVGGTQDARMSGVIGYLDTLSDGAGITGLEQIRDDYLVTAASIPLMHTAAQIADAREVLRVQSLRFNEETKAEMITFNGSDDALRTSIRASQDAADKAFSGVLDTLWLANESARLTLFNRDSTNRELLLRTLGKQGIDTIAAENISIRIDAFRPDLQAALTNRSSAALDATNSAIKDVTHEFRDTVAGARNAHEIALKRDTMMAMH